MSISWADACEPITTEAETPLGADGHSPTATASVYVPPHLRKCPKLAESQSPDKFSCTLPPPRPATTRGSKSEWNSRRGSNNNASDFNYAEFLSLNSEAYDGIPVETRGNNVPHPVDTFVEIDLGEAANENIRKCNYLKPTPVQRHAIPICLAGRDLMACAQTGSGKTAAFCLPIIAGIMKSHCCVQPRLVSQRRACPLALIMSPTRELAHQIHEVARKFSHGTHIRVVVVNGGVAMHLQTRALRGGVEILVATPGRLLDLLERAAVSLSMVKYLVLDEADRMLDMGFEPQIRKIVEKMDLPPPGQRQTMLFSATFATDVQRMAADFLENHIFLSVGRVGSSTDLIVQRVELVLESNKTCRLMEILTDSQRDHWINGRQPLTLVFVATKKGADCLDYCLRDQGFRSVAIHGDRTQQEREHALRSFKTGRARILVATDVAARGLDIPDIAHVVNFDLPNNIDDYVHRIGRTGRAGKTGLATAFFNETNRSLARPLVELMRESKQEIPGFLLQGECDHGCGLRNHQFRVGGGYDYGRDGYWGGGGHGGTAMGVANGRYDFAPHN